MAKSSKRTMKVELSFGWRNFEAIRKYAFSPNWRFALRQEAKERKEKYRKYWRAVEEEAVLVRAACEVTKSLGLERGCGLWFVRRGNRWCACAWVWVWYGCGSKLRIANSPKVSCHERDRTGQ